MVNDSDMAGSIRLARSKTSSTIRSSNREQTWMESEIKFDQK
jgi:hypothetical protein